MKRTLIIPLLLTTATALHGQGVTTRTIAWSCSKVFEASTSRLEVVANKLTTYKVDSIVWRNAKGLKKTLTIKKVVGSWLDTNTIGEVLYQVERGQQRGTVLIKKSAGGTMIRIVLTEASGSTAPATPAITELTVSGILDL